MGVTLHPSGCYSLWLEQGDLVQEVATGFSDGSRLGGGRSRLRGQVGFIFKNEVLLGASKLWVWWWWCVCVCVCVYIYVCVYICVCVYIYVCVCEMSEES